MVMTATAMLVMYMIMVAISSTLMMVVMSVIVTTTRPIRRMLMGVNRGQKRYSASTAHGHGARTHQARF